MSSRLTLISTAVVVAIAVAAVGLMTTRGADDAQAQPFDIATSALDLVTTGNTGTNIGAGGAGIDAGDIQSTLGLPTTALFTPITVDIVVDEIPVTVVDPNDGGLSGVAGEFNWSPAASLRVINPLTGSGLPTLHFSGGGGIPLELADARPDTDGTFRFDNADLSGTFESGPGVVLRLTVECLEVGAVPITLTDTITGANDTVAYLGGPNALYTVATELEGTIYCGMAEPPPSATLNVSKDFSDNAATEVTFSVSCSGGATVTNTDDTATEGSPAVFTIGNPGAAVNCDVTETPVPAGYVVNDSACQNVPVVTANAVENCTVTNTPRSATITVNKNFDEDRVDTVGVELTCSSGTVSPPGTTSTGSTTFSEASPAVFTITGFNTGATCTATEPTPFPGYIMQEEQCGHIVPFILTLTDGAALSCTIYNTSLATVTVNKNFIPNADGVSASLTLTCPGAAVNPTPDTATESPVADPAVFTVTSLPVGVQCTIAEAPIQGWVFAVGTCDATALNLDPGDVVNCTVTNTETTATLTVTKDFTDNNAAAVTITPTCPAGVTVAPVSAPASEATPAVFTITRFDNGMTCTIAETGVPSGYAMVPAGSTCDEGVTLNNAGTPSCVFQNAPSSGTFTVNVDFIGNRPGLQLGMTLNCTTGNPDSNPKPAEEGGAGPAIFTVTAFDSGATCDATPAALPGYSVVNTCLDVPLVNGGNAGCLVTLTSVAIINVDKNFITDFPGGEATISVSCATGTVTPVDATAVEGVDAANFTVSGFDQATACTVSEDPITGWVFNAGTCAGLTIVADDTINCTVTNTETSAVVTVNKAYTDATVTPVTITPSCPGAGVIYTPTTDTAAPLDPAVFTITRFANAGVNCSFTESNVPAGYAQSATNCDVLTVQNGGTPACTITNAPTSGTITVSKDMIPDNATPVTVTVTCTSGNVAPSAAQPVTEGTPVVWTITAFATSATCSATETSGMPAGYSEDNADCQSKLMVNGGNVNCTITNTSTLTFQVSKDFTDDSVATVQVTLTCTSGTISPNGATPRNLTEAAPVSYTITAALAGATCTATETGQASGYDTTGNCTNGASDGGCIITNTLRTTTVTIDMDFTDNNPMDVTFAYSCTSGVMTNIDTTASESDDGGFTLNGNDSTVNCTITQTVPAGYSTNGTATDCSFNVGPVAPVFGALCIVVNEPTTTDFVVSKDYTTASAGPVTVQLTCSDPNAVIAPPSAQTDEGGPPASFTVTYWSPGTTCTASEGTPPTGFSEDNTDCQDKPLVHEGQVSCTIVNRDEVEWTVYKWADPPHTVVITLTCTSGTVTIQDFTANNADPANFIVSNFTGGATCTATEAVPAGYTSNQSDCLNQPVTRGTCLILNHAGTAVPTFSPTPPSPTTTPVPPSPTTTPSPTPVGQTQEPRATRTPVGGPPSPTATPTPTPVPTDSPSPSPSPTITPIFTGPTFRPTRTPVPSNGPFSLFEMVRRLGDIF